MAKDPAILFYAQDFLTGTMFMSNEQVGIYIRLLCAQHQHGGLIDKNSFNGMVKDDQMIRSKFIETEDGFFNERLMLEMNKRAKKSKNLSANAKARWEKYKTDAIALQKDVPIENENEDVNDTTILNNTIQAKNSEFGKQFSQTESLMENAMRTAKAFNLDWQRERILDYLRAYVNEMNAKQEVKPKFKDFSSHFVSWMKIHAKKVQPSQVQPQYKPLDGN